jgi:hypothetical protein
MKARSTSGAPVTEALAGVLVAGLALREPSLDDVFLNLTGHKAEDVVAVPTEEPATRKKGRR